MYKYSQVRGADEVIEKDLEKIKEAVKGNTNASVYLFGSYSKGEGGFSDGKAVNDYDILVIGGTEELRKKIQKVDVTTMVEVHLIPEGARVEMTQQTFETMYTAELLYGKDILADLDRMEPYDIPYADAINSLNKRVISMLVGKHEMMKEDPDNNKIMTQIGKMIIALGDAILIKRGQFNPSYRSRLIMLESDAIFPFYTLSVEHKLFGLTELNPDELWNLWNQTQKYFAQYCIDNQIKTDFSDMLINFDERVEIDALGKILEILGAGEWL